MVNDKVCILVETSSERTPGFRLRPVGSMRAMVYRSRFGGWGGERGADGGFNAISLPAISSALANIYGFDCLVDAKQPGMCKLLK